MTKAKSTPTRMTARGKCNAFLAQWLEDAVANVPDCQATTGAWDLEDIAFTLRQTAEELEELAEQIENADHSESNLAKVWDEEQKKLQADAKRRRAKLATMRGRK